MTFPHGSLGRGCACALILASFKSPNAFGGLSENEVMLLYNSQDPESDAIAADYRHYHPNAIACDLNIAYSAPADYPNCGITHRYITPCRFNELFLDGPSPFLTCLEQNPQILAIVTTRGLPAVISDTLSPTLGGPPCGGAGAPQPCGGLYASFEATLSRLGIGLSSQADPDVAYDFLFNPYYPGDYPYQAEPFADFLSPPCGDPGEPCLGEMFLVSRLDSHTADKDFDGDGDADNVDAVFRMIVPSVGLTANKYATSAIFDTSPSSPAGFDPDEYLPTAIALWNDQWCYYYEDTDEFIEGPDDPSADPQLVDAGFNKWPIVAMQTWGRWHGGPDAHGGDYVGYYNAHPGGVFLSKESFNGWGIHRGDGVYPGEPNPHGQVLEWISAGGGFTVGYVQEPTTAYIADPRVLFKNFFVYGLSWGEAVTASLPALGLFARPIGDPLATITAYNPDITGDRVVDQADMDIVLAEMGQQGPDLDGDINHDGIVNKADLLLVREAFGRNATQPPTEPFPGIGCGDMNGDGWVDQADLDLFYPLLTFSDGTIVPTPCPLLDCYADCPCEGDLNGDAIIDSQDETIILHHLDTYLFDLDGNGCFDGNDLAVFFGTPYACSGDVDYNPAADFNCDGCVNFADLTLIFGHAANPTTPCP